MKASKVIAIAKNEVGYLEKKSNKDLDSKTANAGYNNYTKYGKWFGLNPAYWCAMFICWIFAQAYGKEDGKKLLCGGFSAACETIRQNFIKSKRYATTNPKAGYIIFFSGTRHAGANHIGLVYKVSSGVVYTIEGNTSTTGGVVDNGGGVSYKQYSVGNSRIMGYGMPEYTEDVSTSKNTSSQASNKATSTSSSSEKITVDGEWGKATTRAAQKVFKTPIDGIVSKQPWKYRKYLTGCSVDSWQFFENKDKYKGGSELIIAIQKHLKIHKDGLCGPDTILYLQKMLKVKEDGVFGKNSVKAFQKYLNKQL